MNVEHYLNATPSSCLPPDCGGNLSSGPANTRLNATGIYNHIPDSTSLNHKLDNLYTVSSLGTPTTNNDDSSSTYKQHFDTYNNKIYVNCPTTQNGDMSAIDNTGACNNDSNCIADVNHRNDADDYDLQDTSGDNCTYNNSQVNAPVWLENAPPIRKFADPDECLDWCKDTGDCKGVQTFYHSDSGNVPKLHCNYYNDKMVIDPTTGITSDGDTQNPNDVQDYIGYNTYVKTDNPYTGLRKQRNTIHKDKVYTGCCHDYLKGMVAPTDHEITSYTGNGTRQYHSDENGKFNLIHFHKDGTTPVKDTREGWNQYDIGNINAWDACKYDQAKRKYTESGKFRRAYKFKDVDCTLDKECSNLIGCNDICSNDVNCGGVVEYNDNFALYNKSIDTTNVANMKDIGDNEYVSSDITSNNLYVKNNTAETIRNTHGTRGALGNVDLLHQTSITEGFQDAERNCGIIALVMIIAFMCYTYRK
jgi:hypothetical protein